MNSKKAKGLRKFARKIVENSPSAPFNAEVTYKKMKKAYKTTKGQK